MKYLFQILDKKRFGNIFNKNRNSVEIEKYKININ